MVAPLPDFWPRAQALCAAHSALLAIDETHTLSSGYGGHARRIGLAPDFFVAGKAIAGGVPCAVYGFTAQLAARMAEFLAAKPAGHSGLGTTLSANALAMAALTANLERVMTHAAYEHMLQLGDALADGLRARIGRKQLPWSIVSVGARVELTFARTPALTARESLANVDPLLERTLHLYLLNRGVLITPFHNMMLVSPATTEAQVQQLLQAFEDCCEELEAA
jgi:glutamate-1-semialdehyde 2,1-aminomutase